MGCRNRGDGGRIWEEKLRLRCRMNKYFKNCFKKFFFSNDSSLCHAEKTLARIQANNPPTTP